MATAHRGWQRLDPAFPFTELGESGAAGGRAHCAAAQSTEMETGPQGGDGVDDGESWRPALRAMMVSVMVSRER